MELEFKGSCLKQDKVFTFFAYELDRWSQDLSANFTLKDCFFGAVKLTKNADPDKYSSSRYGIGFDSRSLFSYLGFDWSKNNFISGVDNSLSLHTDNKKRDLLVFGEGPTQGLNDTAMKAETKYSINFSRSQIKFCLSLYSNGINSFFC